MMVVQLILMLTVLSLAYSHVTLIDASSSLLASNAIEIDTSRYCKVGTSKSSSSLVSKRITTSKSSSLLTIRGGSTQGDGVDWRFFLAGGLCAAISHGWTTPIDVIKTRMQQNPTKYNKGAFNAAKDIVANDGFGFLLAGLGPTVVGYGFEGALKFGFYETFKKVFAKVTPHKVINYLLASVLAGIIASLVLCPMEETRIKMVGDKSWVNENLVSGLIRLIRENGFLSILSSFPAMISKQVPYTMSKQVSFDIISGIFYSMALKMHLDNDDMKWPISIASAFFASILACLGSQPGDMILTSTYEGHGNKDILSVVKSIYSKHGLGGFYLGLQARLVHVASIITSQLVLYDVIKMILGLPATGSH